MNVKTPAETAESFTKLADVSVKVPYRRPGNVVEHRDVAFEVFQSGDYFKVVPAGNAPGKSLINLPAELAFQIKNNRLYILRYEYRDLLQDLVNELVRTGKLSAGNRGLPVIHQRLNS